MPRLHSASPRPVSEHDRSHSPGAEKASDSRFFDVILRMFACGVSAPFFAAAALWIKVDDGGPVFFRQPRLGRNRQPFPILKFRTMRGGQAITCPGRWLRRTGLDETAQFINILLGEMRLVGPRPLTADHVTRLGWHGREFDGRWAAKPGITGLAQVFGGRSARHSRHLDVIYARRRSLRLDCWLIAVSFAMNLYGKSRVREKLRALRRRNARQRSLPAVRRVSEP